jgi:run domain Beclin-1 interacting cysteine-rich containing protein
MTKSKALEKQGYQCAGCGLTVQLLSYVKRFRQCTYLGKYFCHSCHSNSACVIPAKVLWKWDWGKYPVSNFARDKVLTGEESICSDPVFDLRAVDQGSLYGKVSVLRKARDLRLQLNQYHTYLKLCSQVRKHGCSLFVCVCVEVGLQSASVMYMGV